MTSVTDTDLDLDGKPRWLAHASQDPVGVGREATGGVGVGENVEVTNS